jgi:hypothetical protein
VFYRDLLVTRYAPPSQPLAHHARAKPFPFMQDPDLSALRVYRPATDTYIPWNKTKTEFRVLLGPVVPNTVVPLAKAPSVFLTPSIVSRIPPNCDFQEYLINLGHIFSIPSTCAQKILYTGKETIITTYDQINPESTYVLSTMTTQFVPVVHALGYVLRSCGQSLHLTGDDYPLGDYRISFVPTASFPSQSSLQTLDTQATALNTLLTQIGVPTDPNLRRRLDCVNESGHHLSAKEIFQPLRRDVRIFIPRCIEL